MTDRPETTNDHFESDAYVTWRAEHGERMRRVASRYVNDLERISGGLPKSAIEVGSATGEVLDALQARGVECWGADLSAPSVEIARRIYPSIAIEVGDFPATPAPVGALLAFHVVEHVPEPVKLLTDARERVHDDGIAYVRVPNFEGLARRTLGKWWPDYMPGHLHYFTRDSMRRCLEGSGWRAEHISTSSDAWVWIGGVKRVLTRQLPGSAAVGAAPPGGNKLRALDAASRILRPVSRVEERFGVGNEFVVVARAV